MEKREGDRERERYGFLSLPRQNSDLFEGYILTPRGTLTEPSEGKKETGRERERDRERERERRERERERERARGKEVELHQVICLYVYVYICTNDEYAVKKC